jgi:hypothetical protein
MLGNFFQMVKIGKELGLSKKEINRVFLFGNSKHSILYILLMIAAFIFIGFVIIILAVDASRNIYPAGTFYSTVKIKDFKGKK